MEKVEPPVGLDVEDEVVLVGRLVGQAAAHLEPGGVDDDVDVAAGFEDAPDDGLDGLPVAEVDSVVVDPATGRLDGLQRAQRRTGAFDPGQLLVDEGGRGPLTRCLQPLEDRPLQALLVGGEGADVGVSRVGLGGRGRAGGTSPATPGRGRQ